MALSPPLKPVVCKICERTVNASQLPTHSLKCKSAAELREVVLKQQNKLFVLASKAYDMRNQLNTNFALQKIKHSKHRSHDYEDAISLQRNASAVVHAKRLPPLKHVHFLDEKNEHDWNINEIVVNPIAEEQQKHREPQLARRYSDEKLHECEEEFGRAVNVLKIIIHYGSRIHSHEVDCDITNDYKVKNEVNLLYVAIKDKKISAYLESFLEELKVFIKQKQNYLKKQEELERVDFCLSVKGSEDSFSSDKHLDVPILSTMKSHRMMSLDDSDVSDIGPERKSRLPDSRWMRRGSAGNPLPPKSALSASQDPKKRGMVTLSKFASPKREKLHENNSSKPSDSEAGTQPDEPSPCLKARKVKKLIPQSLYQDLNRISNIFFRFEKRLSKVFSFHEHEIQSTKKTEQNQSSPNPKKLMRNQTTRFDVIIEQKNDSRNILLKATGSFKQKKTDEGSPFLFGDTTENSKKRQSWNQIRKEMDMCSVIIKPPEELGVCHEEDQALLSKSQLSSSNDSSDEYSEISNEESKGGKKNDNYDDEIFEGISKMNMRAYYSDSEVHQMKKTCPVKTCEVSIEDFHFLKFIGEGAYGKIYLVKKKATGDVYAMKIVNFEDRESTHNKMSSLRAESDAYKSIKGDWVVKAYYTFSYKHYVCFVLEYMIGGDLEGLLEQVGCFEEPVARFYFAELVLALESLHILGIVHRDLKPDNVLIDSDGHIKLTDFGLSEKGVFKRIEIATSALTRRPSYDVNTTISRNSLTKDVVSQLKESMTNLFTRAPSMEPNAIEPEGLRSPENLIRLPSTFSDFVGMNANIEQESYIMKNKNDEQTVFTFLNGDETRRNWIGKTKLTTSDTTGTVRKKEVHRIVGTPDYMAPEIIKGDNCSNKSIDLWSLGVILYEFLVGIPPFNEDSVEKIFDNIVHLRLEWPSIGYGDDCITPEASDLIKRLLEPDSKKRLTLPEVKAHPFFKNFNWSAVKDLPAPVIPKKKEIEATTPIGIHNIFTDKPGEDQKKGMKRRGLSFEEMTNFEMKRIDLLHQLNQSVYKTHLLSTQETTVTKSFNAL